MSPFPATIADAGDDDDTQEIAFAKRRFKCFCIQFGSSKTSWLWWERVPSPGKKERWWKKNVREWSELTASHNWKTFIRRFNNNKTRAALYARYGSFRYDPLSYALNFDDGNTDNGTGEDGSGYAGFSARFASIPAPPKSAADIRKDAPALTSESGAACFEKKKEEATEL
ncbi:hypothetical protein VNO77_35450 [Canavalia gladiata]|uniref:Uncharacterized protein n=1 Tax=Canavalia gladiata TaxID=3824 RepID=A0AAN9KF65_CANGL